MARGDAFKMSPGLWTWENPVQTGTLFGVGNSVLLALYLELPLLAYAVSYGGLLVLVAGLACKVSKAVKKEDVNFESLVPKEQVAAASDWLYEKLSEGVTAMLPIAFWDDVQVSFAATLAMYVLGFWLMSWVSLSFLALSGFNGVLVYGKFQKEILKVAGPHLELAVAEMNKLWSKIPRYEKKE